MDRDERVESFYISQIGSGMEKLKELDRFCWKNRDCFKEELERTFKRLAEGIASAQREKGMEEIFCISLCFFRSKFLMREGTIRIFGLDKRFFLDPDPVWEEMDLSPLCAYIWALEDGMTKELLRDRSGLSPSDVQGMIQTEYVPLLIGYMTELARYAVRKGGNSWLDSILTTDGFSIMAGEYQGSLDQIYVTEAVDTRGRGLGRYLDVCKADAASLACKRYRNETLENMDLSGMNFTKSHFEQVRLCSSSLEGGILLKTEWAKCSLPHNSWKGAFLFGADFSGSDLSGSDFSGIVAPVIPPSLVFPATLSWCGLDFTNACLHDVKFTGADVRGADFKGAAFGRTDFSGAQLDDAIFTLEGSREAELTDGQRERIRIEG